MSGERRPRVAAPQAKQVLIESTISLLGEIPVVELTTRKIEERAGLDRRAITRQFGGELGLFIATLEELNLRAVHRAKSLSESANSSMNNDLKIRTNLLAFLILSGADTERLKAIGQSPEVVEAFKKTIGMHPETPEAIEGALLALLQGLILARTFFGPTTTRNTPENEVMGFKLLQFLASQGPEWPALLGLEEG